MLGSLLFKPISVERVLLFFNAIVVFLNLQQKQLLYLQPYSFLPLCTK
ncbi:hypothetical protein PPRY_a2307 [Pseudoalteromonas prydzensis ACAM 620]|nr:hypothetical protein [Pseudoalteromonas prydzensis ACAM 620]